MRVISGKRRDVLTDCLVAHGAFAMTVLVAAPGGRTRRFLTADVDGMHQMRDGKLLEHAVMEHAGMERGRT
jgi:hypothetical protein